MGQRLDNMFDFCLSLHRQDFESLPCKARVWASDRRNGSVMPSRRERAGRLARVFIGSSSTSLGLARQLKTALVAIAPQAAVTVWDEAFRPGQLLLGQIVRLVQEYDFGIFVFAADDVLLIRGQQARSGKRLGPGRPTAMTVRDNVLFEAGVFMGGLGHERTFLVVPRGLGHSLRTPSDLDGLLTANYRITKRRKSGSNGEADIDVAAQQIATSIRELGPAPRTAYDELLALRQILDECEFKDGKRRLVVLGHMVLLAAHTRNLPWHSGVDPMDLMAPIRRKWGNSAADTAYWWLVVYGVFRFMNIDQFTSGEGWNWDDSIEYVELSRRGAALLNVFQKQPNVNGSVEGRVPRS
jgi:predicted nucleotide-binding protein